MVSRRARFFVKLSIVCKSQCDITIDSTLYTSVRGSNTQLPGNHAYDYLNMYFSILTMLCI